MPCQLTTAITISSLSLFFINKESLFFINSFSPPFLPNQKNPISAFILSLSLTIQFVFFFPLMAKGGKLSLKSMFQKWKSSSSSSSSTNLSASSSARSDDDSLQTVYVGKSRRRYLISSQLVDHPLFRVLAHKSSSGEGLTVGCEVVLFEHFLWMLANADQHPDSLQELVEFYAC